MTRIYIVVIVFLLTTTCCGQASPHYFLSDKPANTPVFIRENGIKKETVYTYTLIPNILKKLIIKDSALSYTCTYDSLGNPLIRQRLFRTPVSNYKDSMVYNSSGQLIHMYQFTTFRGTQRKMSINDYSYDSAGNRIGLYSEIFVKDSIYKNESLYTYNEKKQLIETYTKEKGITYLYSTMLYSKDGKLLRTDYFKENGEMTGSQVFEYNHRKNKIVQSSLTNGKAWKGHVSEYNDKGQCTLIELNYSNPVRVDLFKYYPNGLFFEMQEIEYGHIKQLSRHFYTTK